jgi:hypothetical protein
VAEVKGTEQRVGPVDLTVPASSPHLRILRLVSSSLGASLGLDIDQLDDLRIAVDELCSLLIEHAPDGASMRVTLSADHDHLVVEGALLSEVPGALIDPVSQLILDGLDVDWTSEAPSPCFRLVAPGSQHRDGP